MLALRSAPPRDAATLDSTPVAFSAADGYVLGGTRFVPSGTSRGLVVINGATGVSHRFYRHFARYLAEHQLEVLTYDYRGIGASRIVPLREMTSTMADWGRLDFDAALRYATETLGHPTVDLVGHSVGGQLVAVAPRAHVIDRVVGIAAQLGDYRFFSGARRWYAAAMMRAFVPPVVRLFGYLPSGLAGEALPPGVALQWAQWCTTRGYFLPDLTSVERERFEQRTGALLAYSFERDPFASSSAVDAWAALFMRASVQRLHVSARVFGHFGFFKPDIGQPHWERVRDFLSVSRRSVPSREPRDLAK